MSAQLDEAVKLLTEAIIDYTARPIPHRPEPLLRGDIAYALRAFADAVREEVLNTPLDTVPSLSTALPAPPAPIPTQTIVGPNWDRVSIRCVPGKIETKEYGAPHSSDDPMARSIREQIRDVATHGTDGHPYDR